MTIISDASLQRWGATCNGVQTRGPWSPQKQILHINSLELLAATLAIRTFAKERSGIIILLKLDNTTAVVYINRMGGTVSPVLSHLTKDLWLLCMEKSITCSTLTRSIEFHCQQGMETKINSSEWKLSPALFQRLTCSWATFNRPVCKQTVSSTASFHQLEARPPGNSQRCLHSGLVQSHEAVCQSTMELNRQSSISDTQPKGSGISSSGTSLDFSTMVPTITSETGQRTTSHSAVA